MTNFSITTPPQRPDPQAAPVAIALSDAQRLFGLSRVTLYRLNAAGRIVFRKAGRKTLVDYQSLLDYVQALPAFQGRTGARSAS